MRNSKNERERDIMVEKTIKRRKLIEKERKEGRETEKEKERKERERGREKERERERERERCPSMTVMDAVHVFKVFGSTALVKMNSLLL